MENSSGIMRSEKNLLNSKSLNAQMLINEAMDVEFIL